ncbi:MAG: HypC/HybG/HupF family hydrogenase formation chaperone [Rouxiella aceris]|uniref:HypC/HybG/HupF family hydrogenase formation chaperone n=1 Tax=Rouxiella aceris TaxID=2703884 RepID=UPI00283F26AF|nr:HypC/HybG/HupF family hydrogenase formation chaperone [Rouxiella aceris]MDR3431671.1 HypC/HybG/HupF family hydrogenase formation chaperone [Rouxiella aceris]
MCIGIPGKIVALHDDAQDCAWAEVSGMRREVNIMLVLGDQPYASLLGKWILIHVGFAMSLLDEAEALDTLAALAAMGEVEDDVGLFLKGEGHDAIR